MSAADIYNILGGNVLHVGKQLIGYVVLAYMLTLIVRSSFK